MFLEEFRKVLGRAIVVSLLLCLFGGAVSAAEIMTSKSRVYIHEDSSGGKARDTIRLPKPSRLPEGSCALFVSAEVKYDKQRFGVAEIKSTPEKGCNAESEVCRATVEWKTAPVGRLHYWVEAKWEVQSSGC